jgi:hypothetical protein
MTAPVFSLCVIYRVGGDGLLHPWAAIGSDGSEFQVYGDNEVAAGVQAAFELLEPPLPAPQEVWQAVAEELPRRLDPNKTYVVMPYELRQDGSALATALQLILPHPVPAMEPFPDGS